MTPTQFYIIFFVLSICAIVSWYLAYRYYTKAKSYEYELRRLKDKYHLDNNLINPKTSPTTNITTTNNTKNDDNRSDK